MTDRRFFAVELGILGELFGGFRHFGCAVELVPVERLAIDGPLHRLEQNNGEELPVGKALNPDMN